MPSITWIPPRGQPLLFQVYKSITTIGDDPTCDICIPDMNLQKLHARMVFDGRDFSLADVDRSTQVIINGRKRHKLRISHGDRINLGDVEITFSIFDPPPRGTQGGGEEAELFGIRRIHEFSEKLMARHDLSELLDALMDYVVSLTRADKGFLILFDNEHPEVRVARNIQKENLTDAVHHLSDSIIAKVVETKKALIVSDALNDEEFRTSESVLNLQLSSVMCVPLLDQGRLLGIIYLGNDKVVDLFTPATLEILMVFAAHASLLIQNALLLNKLKLSNEDLHRQLDKSRFGEIIGTCPAMLEVYNRVEKVAPTGVSVLISGETGTGKELIAHEIHRRAPRAKKPFVTINCGSIPENLMESELFGHVRGAFTGAVSTRLGKFQAANTGTIFLDEIGEMPLGLQVKLLRVLQEHVLTKVGSTKPEKVDIRVLAATNKQLEEEVRENRFREDLYYRLNVVHIELPPLRERGEDIAVLARYLLVKYAEEFGSKIKGFTADALIALKKYDWPGNVRQLENRIKKAVIMAESSMVGPEDLELTEDKSASIMTLSEAKEAFQQKYILEVLERNDGNRTKTARDLGVDPRTIFRYLEK